MCVCIIYICVCAFVCVYCIVCIYIIFTKTCTFSQSYLVYNSNVEAIALCKAYHGASKRLCVCIWHAGVAGFFFSFFWSVYAYTLPYCHALLKPNVCVCVSKISARLFFRIEQNNRVVLKRQQNNKNITWHSDVIDTPLFHIQKLWLTEVADQATYLLAVCVRVRAF